MAEPNGGPRAAAVLSGIAGLLMMALAAFGVRSIPRGLTAVPFVVAALLLVSSVLHAWARPRAIVIAQGIHCLLLGAAIDAAAFLLFVAINPYTWGALLVAAPALFVFAGVQLASLLCTVRGRLQSLGAVLASLASAALIPAGALAAFGIWNDAPRVWAILRYPGSDIASAEKANGWVVVRNDPKGGGVYSWRAGSRAAKPILEGSKGLGTTGELAAGLDRVVIASQGRVTLFGLTGQSLAQAEVPEGEPGSCPWVDAQGGAWLLSSDGIVQWPRGEPAPGLLMENAPEAITCPTASADGRLWLWTLKDGLRLTRFENGALHDVARWPRPGQAFLAPDGTFVLEFRGKAVSRRHVATGEESPLARLPLEVLGHGAYLGFHPSWDGIQPQAFSPDGRFFLLSSRGADRCRRRYWALDTKDGGLTPLPLYAPLGECSSRDWASHDPEVVRWAIER